MKREEKKSFGSFSLGCQRDSSGEKKCEPDSKLTFTPESNSVLKVIIGSGIVYATMFVSFLMPE